MSLCRSFSTQRPFRILGLQQIAIGGLSKQELSNFWVDALGVEKTGTYRAEVPLPYLTYLATWSVSLP